MAISIDDPKRFPRFLRSMLFYPAIWLTSARTWIVERQRTVKRFALNIAIFAITFLLVTHVAAATEIVLHSFVNNTCGGLGVCGSQSVSGLIADASGALYGTTSTSGSKEFYCCGSVFKLTPPAPGHNAWTETVLHRFGKSRGDGTSPRAGLIMDASGALYGTTSTGGICDDLQLFHDNCGVVFKLAPPASGETSWTETVLYRFRGGTSDGVYPQAGLVMDKGGALYGTTDNGGSDGGNGYGHCPQRCGTVFMLTPPKNGQAAWSETVLHFFKSGRDGANPHAGLVIGKGGALYGTTEIGGDCPVFAASGGCGTVFELTPPVKEGAGWNEEIIYRFKGKSDGARPLSLIRNADGTLFGTTIIGGAGHCSFFGDCGTVFKLTPPADEQSNWIETILYRFKGHPDGANPHAGLILENTGALYGTTSGGGNNACSGGCGTVFKLAPPSVGKALWNKVIVYRFGDSDGDGVNPEGSLIVGRKGKLYSTTSSGGKWRFGTVVEITQ